MISLHTGMRKSEIMSLRWSDLDFARREIRVRGSTTKTGQPLIAPMSEKLVAFLQSKRPALLKERAVPRVKREHRELPFHNTTDWHWFKLRKRAGPGFKNPSEKFRLSIRGLPACA